MSNHGRKLPRAKIDYMVAEYKRGRNMPQIAEEVGVSAATVRNYLMDEKVERRPAGAAKLVTEELLDIAAQMQAEGTPWKIISRKIGLSTSVLEKAIRKRKKEHLLMPAKKFTEKQTEYIVEQYKKGRSSHCLAREMGVTMQTILIYLEDQNVVRRVAGARKRVTLELVETAQALRAEGNKWAYIEAKVGVSRETLRQAIIRMKGGKEV